MRLVCFVLTAGLLLGVLSLDSGVLPHDTLLTAYTRAHGREDLYVRDYAYTRGRVVDGGRYSLQHAWSGNVELQSVLVCPTARVAPDTLLVRFIHDTRLEGDCALRGNY